MIIQADQLYVMAQYLPRELDKCFHIFPSSFLRPLS